MTINPPAPLDSRRSPSASESASEPLRPSLVRSPGPLETTVHRISSSAP
jgi:hypothetical protein